MSAADHDVKPGDSQDEVCKCGHLHAEHYGKVATARCTVCEGPARPVEDREPVGPYAPTRDGRTLNARYEADPGLFEAGYRQGWRERDIDGAPRYPDLTKWDGTYGGRGDHPDTVAELKRIRETEFERGRQQGDAAWAQREAEAEREFEMELESKLIEARGIARAAVEAELLDQGWTPPGAIGEMVRVDYHPSDYEVWRDALSMATEWASMHGRDPQLAAVLEFAKFFRDKLINYPTISPAEADQAADDQIARIDSSQPLTMRTVVDGQEDTWVEVGPDQWLMVPVSPPYDPGYLNENARDLKYIEQMYGLKSV